MDAGAAAYAVLAPVSPGPVAPDWWLGMACGFGGLFGGYLGARLQPHLPETALRLLLGTLAAALGMLCRPDRFLSRAAGSVAAWGVHDDRHPGEADQGADDVESVRTVAVGQHAPRDRPSHEDAAVRGEDPAEVVVGLEGGHHPYNPSAMSRPRSRSSPCARGYPARPARHPRSRTGRRRAEGTSPPVRAAKSAGEACRFGYASGGCRSPTSTPRRARRPGCPGPRLRVGAGAPASGFAADGQRSRRAMRMARSTWAAVLACPSALGWTRVARLLTSAQFSRVPATLVGQ